MPAVAADSAPEVLGLLSHDLRWRLLQALARSDRRVNELVERTGERQNLISYHLGLLKRAHLVHERRSSADARDVYYHLDLDRLDSELKVSASSLHPALPHSAGRPTHRPRRSRRPRVLFVCTGNSARSQMAEAILRRQAGRSVEVFSAGPRPAGLHPIALEVLADLNLPTKALRSKGIDEVAGIDFDLVVTLCDIAREDCPPQRGHPEYVHWSVADPTAVAGSLEQRRRVFRATYAELSERINHLIAQLTLADPREARKPSDGGTT
ncbi:MAG TPA: ArsR family transcriptional regulator [Clostridia bacterium]|nr:ArsR family transcriptional regulator [Clostridia bacterium]